MATNRKLIFTNGEIYHVYNRGVERRPVFMDKKEHQRAADLLSYYRFANLPMRYSQLLSLPLPSQETIWERVRKENNNEVLIFAYCLMPNHFHLVIRQLTDGGVSRFTANFTNSYTKYFNTKHRRVGSLFQGPFKAVRVETDEQLLHLTRYVHLNPFASFLLKLDDLESYPWSSFSEYIGGNQKGICDTSWLKNYFSTVEGYRKFVYDYANYAQELEKIKHLAIDEK